MRYMSRYVANHLGVGPESHVSPIEYGMIVGLIALMIASTISLVAPALAELFKAV
jgi:Flp pilus assembly pilin Flp